MALICDSGDCPSLNLHEGTPSVAICVFFFSFSWQGRRTQGRRDTIPLRDSKEASKTTNLLESVMSVKEQKHSR